MIDFTAHTQTLSNDSNATIVSPIEQSGSPKNELLKSLKAGKLRKNAKKKIADLLVIATEIELQTQSMNYYDDTYDYNKPKILTISEFWVWYEENYKDLEVYLNGKKGDLIHSVTFSDCPYHFSNDVVLTFDLKEDITDSLNNDVIENIEPVILSDLSKINLNTLDDIHIKNIEIIWSESNYFNDGEILTLAEYDNKSIKEALEIGRGQGYAKTKINLHLVDGNIMVHRHDIDADHSTLTIDLAHCGYNAIQVAIKPKFTYSQIKRALDTGFISPLNHDRKEEPTPPTDKKSRHIVSLGNYVDRLDSKRKRLESRAEKAAQNSAYFYKRSTDLADMIPFGQPILIGHHSEGRARRHHERIWNDMGKSVAADNKAEYLQHRADNLGNNGIASDDPEAIQKLKEKLTNLESSQETMKAINKVIRSKHTANTDKIEYMITTHHLTEKQALETLNENGFASYSLQNNNATIRATRERIQDLEKLHNQEPLSATGEIDGLSWSLFEDDGRLQFSFDDKPSETIRKTLKSHAFTWSPSRKTWVRKITPNSVIITKRLIQQF